jgi:endonuclease/exonuclease/phosphatase family metal-dependent hydrolase
MTRPATCSARSTTWPITAFALPTAKVTPSPAGGRSRPCANSTYPAASRQQHRSAQPLLVKIDAPAPIGAVLLVANHATAFELDREADREHQAVVIAGLLEREVASGRAHVIVAGDLNAHPDAASIRYWTGAQSLNGTSVCYRDAWTTLYPYEPGHTFTPETA